MNGTRTVTGAVAAVVAAVGMLSAGCGSDSKPETGQPAGKPQAVPTADRAKLPKATTFGSVRGAPADPAPSGRLDGTVVQVRKDAVVYDKPGGRPVAMLPSRQLKGPTWVPVVAKKAGWRQVLLPSRPAHSSGWVADGTGLKEASSPYRVEVDVAKHRLVVRKGGQAAGSWPVAVGTKKNPTPAGRTFMLASLSPSHPTYSKLIFPLGTHSNSLDRFGGGPGTVALHGWPDRSAFGKNISHGCVRMPTKALATLARIPLGSPVQIT